MKDKSMRDEYSLTSAEFTELYLTDFLVVGQGMPKKSGLFDLLNGYFLRVTAKGPCFHGNRLGESADRYHVTSYIKGTDGKLEPGVFYTQFSDAFAPDFTELKKILCSVAELSPHRNAFVPLTYAADDLPGTMVPFAPELFEKKPSSTATDRPSGSPVPNFLKSISLRAGS